MKYLQLITNKYSLALLVVLLLALLCLMSTSELTLWLIVIKIIGLALAYAFLRLYAKWECDGKIDFIYDLFNDDHDED